MDWVDQEWIAKIKLVKECDDEMTHQDITNWFEELMDTYELGDVMVEDVAEQEADSTYILTVRIKTTVDERMTEVELTETLVSEFEGCDVGELSVDNVIEVL